ncbi:MAG: hypothetical protein JRJ59_02550 [Deltaproteobacteria bacterium]|nr:hypothetical protein [Deltaproteobacteria bacterium]
MNFEDLSPDLFKAHLIFAKMSRYPHYFREMREVFRWTIEEKGLATAEDLEKAARKKIEQDGLDPNDANLVEQYLNAITDICFASAVDLKAADGYINLAPKLAKNRQLAKVLHWENASSREIFKLLEEFCLIPLGDRIIPEAEAIGVRVALINHFISNQLPYVSLAKKHITIRDIYFILQRTIWDPDRSGRIGGKAAGMILAHRILVPLLHKGNPRFADRVDVADSYFIRSEIFDEFIQGNNLEKFHSRKYETREKLEEEFPKIRAQFEKAHFSNETIQGFRYILEKIGEHPIILRSSSFLEDNFGLAFSGKYDSVFLANQGDLETRLQEFIRAIKRVHLSTYHPDPILYRVDHNLLDYNEHMSVLVQKVIGRQFGHYFFPLAAGVIFSVNSFTWNPKIDRKAGLIRMVFGLGTRAVDRVGADYPRMVPLSHPTLRPEADAASIKKYSQRKVDVVNLKTGRLESVNLTDLLSKIKHPDIHQVISLDQGGGHLAPPTTRLTKFEPRQACVTFDRLLKETDFADLIHDIVQTVAQAYGRPVDMEFAYDQGKVYVLQCRTLSLPKQAEHVVLPTNIPPDQVIFTARTGLPNRIIADIEYVVYVDPLAYDRLTDLEEKIKVGRVVNQLNQALSDKRYILFGPGRWGSNDINLGVQVRYHDISRTKILGEVAFATDGSTPEVSYGTHFFNDLVEADIVPLPIYPDEPGTTFNRSFFLDNPSLTSQLAPGFNSLNQVVRVIRVPDVAQGLYLQVFLNGANSEGMAFLGPKQAK